MGSIEQFVAGLLTYLGSAASLGGLIIWFLKRYIQKTDKKREEEEKAREAKEQKKEDLMRIMMRENHATYILVAATAKAVQRIPDAQCNGDMKKAFEDAAACQKAEKDFLVNEGIDNIFGRS